MKGKLLHKRRIETESYEYGESSILVVGRLVDDFNIDIDADILTHPAGTAHDLRVEMEIRLPDFTITAARAEMLTVPYEGCREVESCAERLIGIRVAAGYSREVRQRLRDAMACSHLMNLILAMPTSALHAGMFRMHEQRNIADPADVDDSFLFNSCHMWREGGPLAAIWRQERAPAKGPGENVS